MWHTAQKGWTAMLPTPLGRTSALLLACVLALSVGACGTSGTSQTDPGGTSQSGEQMPDPFQDFDTLEEAEQAVGFDITVPEVEATQSLSHPASTRTYRASADNKLIEVIYLVGNPDVSDEAFRIRKAPGTDDVSGDYTDYPETSQGQVGDTTVTLKGKSGRVSCVTWTDGNYSYAIDVAASDGFAKDEALALVEAID